MSKDIKEFVPKHHLDNSYIDELMELTEEEIKPIVLDLITWLKDMSKPIANQLMPILLKNENILEDVIKSILDDQKKDTIWKYNIIFYLIRKFNLDNKKKYFNSLKRIYENPNKYELYYETNLAAKI